MNKVDIETYTSGERDVFHDVPTADVIKELISYHTKKSQEFLQKEEDLHKRTEAVIKHFGVDTNVEESASGQIELKTDDSTVIAIVKQKKSAPNRSKDRTIVQCSIQFAEVIEEDGDQFTQTYYVHGINHKIYGHFAIPGLQTAKLLHSIDAYKIQEEYELFLEQIEIALGIATPLEKTD